MKGKLKVKRGIIYNVQNDWQANGNGSSQTLQD